MIEDKSKKHYSYINSLKIIPNYKKIETVPKFFNYKNQKIEMIPIVINNNKIITHSKNITELR